jgi:hypothetical protein
MRNEKLTKEWREMEKKYEEINIKKEYSARLNKLFESAMKKTKDELEQKKDKFKISIEMLNEIEAAGFAYEKAIRKNNIIWVGIGCAFNKKDQARSGSGKEDHLKDGKGIFIDSITPGWYLYA